MIFVLLFVLLLGFLVYKKTYKYGILKTKKKFLLAKNLSKKRFFYAKVLLFYEESKKLLENGHLKNIAKSVDNVLLKVRLNSPKESLSIKESVFFYSNLNSKPVYVIKNKKELNVVELALKFDEFYAVYFSDKGKSSKNLLCNKINFFNIKNKKLKTMLEKLDINTPLPKQIKTIYYLDEFVLENSFKKSYFVTEAYLLEKYQSKNLDFFVYRFFVGECLSYVKIKNKTENNLKFEFKYFYDLAGDKINYFEFCKKQNFVLIKNLKKDNVFYFNFSYNPTRLITSSVLGLEKSNLPCLFLKYNLDLPASQSKNLSFMFSKNTQFLPFLNFKKLYETSFKNLKEIFSLKLDFFDKSENDFFIKSANSAKIILLKNSLFDYVWYKGSYEFLKKKFLKKEIDALCFYISVKKSLIETKKDMLICNPYFYNSDFVVSFGNLKSVSVIKQNLKVPYLVLDGTKYYNNFTISFEYLKNKSAKILV